MFPTFTRPNCLVQIARHLKQCILPLWSILMIHIKWREIQTIGSRATVQYRCHSFPTSLLTPRISFHVSYASTYYTKWRSRLSHTRVERLIMASGEVGGIPRMDRFVASNTQYTASVASKSKHVPLHHPFPRCTRPLELTHTDMSGKTSVSSLGGL